MNRRAASILWPAAAFAAIVWLIPQAVFAHGFGEKYDLPVPSFILRDRRRAGRRAVIHHCRRLSPQNTKRNDYPRFDLLRLRPVRLLASGPAVQALRIVAVLILLLVLLTGALGINRSTMNIAPVLVWVYWWVGIAFTSALIGNIWGLINPVRTIYEWTDALARHVLPGGLSFGQDRCRLPSGLGRVACGSDLHPVRVV